MTWRVEEYVPNIAVMYHRYVWYAYVSCGHVLRAWRARSVRASSSCGATARQPKRFVTCDSRHCCCCGFAVRMLYLHVRYDKHSQHSVLSWWRIVWRYLSSYGKVSRCVRVSEDACGKGHPFVSPCWYHTTSTRSTATTSNTTGCTHFALSLVSRDCS